jgi:hypothetical protein
MAGYGSVQTVYNSSLRPTPCRLPEILFRSSTKKSSESRS